MLIAIIGVGLLNFLSYTIIYAIVGGDAKNGWIEDGNCFVRGHFLHPGKQGQATHVSAAVWVYSSLHSISIWPTIGGVLSCMLLLARPHIIATMQEDHVIRGEHFVTASMTLIVIVTAASMVYFLFGFFQALSALHRNGTYGL